MPTADHLLLAIENESASGFDSAPVSVWACVSPTLGIEASDLGYRAGEPMPRVLRVDGARFNYEWTCRDCEGAVTAWDYRAGDGRLLRIFND